jgi:hypothetical protein
MPTGFAIDVFSRFDSGFNEAYDEANQGPQE